MSDFVRRVSLTREGPFEFTGGSDQVMGVAGESPMDRRAVPRPQRVLVVDDNPDSRELWSVWLTHYGFQVEEAANGADAVHKAVASRPVLVLMDLWMPVMDGLTATARLKADPRTAAIPVIALSAHAADSVPSRATAACVDAISSESRAISTR